ncbi:hypothetical protein ACQ4M3_01950 [Leptolyngbya sp. AN03gr2]|uniref:hypothetical protein n=1 Tax=unclassified Leptolyngbya TaxID=2650499 RepID=UPI003D31868C
MTTLEQALLIANQLTEIDKLRLVQQLVMEIDLANLARSQQSKISSFGVFSQLGKAPSEIEIDQTRQEMYANFGESL